MHFKPCSLKNDVPPDLMLQYWDNINSDSKRPKKFPRDLLISYIGKCVKEGRIGEQVDYAKALVLSLSDGDTEAVSNELSQITDTSQASSTADSMAASSIGSAANSDNNQPEAARDVTQELLRNAANLAKERPAATSKRPPTRQKYRLELVEESVKRSNIELRIDRELAASREHRYKEALHEGRCVPTVEIHGDDDDDDDDECMIVQDNSSVSGVASESTIECKPVDLGKLFFLARLKDCDNSDPCQQSNCDHHELRLLLEEFKSYSGKSMDAPPAAPSSIAMQSSNEPEELKPE